MIDKDKDEHCSIVQLHAIGSEWPINSQPLEMEMAKFNCINNTRIWAILPKTPSQSAHTNSIESNSFPRWLSFEGFRLVR